MEIRLENLTYDIQKDAFVMTVVVKEDGEEKQFKETVDLVKDSEIANWINKLRMGG